MNKPGRKPKPILRIGVDCGALSTEDPKYKGGVYTVVFNLLLQLSLLDKKNSYIFYSFAPIPKQLLQRFGKRAKNTVLSPSFGYKSVRLPLALQKDKPDLFLALSQAVFRNAPKTIGFVYDVAFLKYSEHYKNAGRLIRNTQEVIAASTQIITISQASKNDICSYYKIDPDKITLAYPGVSEVFKPIGPKFIGQCPYFLYVGHLKKSKNIPKIIEAFAAFLKQSKQMYQLVLVGSDADFDISITEAIKRFDVEKSVIQKGYVPFRDLPKYYRGAQALISPAIYEGFGLPIVEAMACGTPVVAGSNSSMIEIVGKGGILVHQNKSNKITEALIELSQNDERKKYKQNALKEAKKFSWKKFTREVLKVIQ